VAARMLLTSAAGVPLNYAKQFRVKPGRSVKLDEVDAAFTGKLDERAADASTARFAQRLSELQYLLYAENQRSLLVCLQGLDAAGKDGVIRHVFGPMNPQGTRVHGFKVPSTIESAHDFLWRIHREVPARGETVIFNRSHYEDVLVTRVHGLVPKKVWSKRYALINDFEENLVEAGTHILKFYLHISGDEQLRRFKKRLDDPKRHWKISEADYTEREFWPEYVRAYEDALRETSTKHAPWFIIPANQKWFRNAAIAEIVAGVLDAMDLKTPKPTVDIEAIRRKYHAAAAGEKSLAGRR
jgi:PPK2 family polyphosphate:nucleotide phosphotransferase